MGELQTVDVGCEPPALAGHLDVHGPFAVVQVPMNSDDVAGLGVRGQGWFLLMNGVGWLQAGRADDRIGIGPSVDLMGKPQIFLMSLQQLRNGIGKPSCGPIPEPGSLSHHGL